MLSAIEKPWNDGTRMEVPLGGFRVVIAMEIAFIIVSMLCHQDTYIHMACHDYGSVV